MATAEQLGRVIVANQQQSARLRAAVEALVLTSWRSLGSWREADVDRWARTVGPRLAGARLQAAALTAAYLATLELAATGRPPRPTPVTADDVSIEQLRGVPEPDVLRRPGVTVWTALAAGQQLEAAVARGLTRALSIATTDLQLARTHAARTVLTAAAAEQRVVGYRRTLTGSESCGLCAVASTQRYHVESLMPIHPGCDCGVAPIFGDVDPGQVINADRLADAHDAIEARFGTADAGSRSVNPYASDADVPLYRDVLVVHEHGELGPVLTVRGHRFTGPDDLDI